MEAKSTNATSATGKQVPALLVIIVACLAIGALGGLATASSVSTWYPTLTKPPWNPPAFVFGPVWTTLYIMMAIAYWLVWRGPSLSQRASVLFAAQLLLNLLWSALFFGLRRPDLAVIEILILLGFIGLTAAEFRKHSKLASLLLLPYILWVSYATSLNIAIAYLNR